MGFDGIIRAYCKLDPVTPGYATYLDYSMPNKTYRCPVCGYPELDTPPYNEQGSASFYICPCCGIEFGYDDAKTSYEELRQRWLERGAPWFSRTTAPPPDWSATDQLVRANLKE